MESWALGRVAPLLFLLFTFLNDSPLYAQNFKTNRVTQSEFSSRYAFFSQGGKIHLSRNSQRFHFVFVGGFLNEGLPGYFSDNSNALLDAGVSRDRIHFIFPNSDHSVEENYIDLKWQLRELRESFDDGEKLILIGHSKGASEVLASILTMSQWSARWIEQVYLIQGAFGGSGVADYIRGKGRPVDKSLPWYQRLLFKNLSLAAVILNWRVAKGFESLETEAAKAFWRSHLQKYSRGVSRLTDRIFYITASTHPEQMSKTLKWSGWYLESSYGRSDGLVLEKDQLLPELGFPLLNLEADHTDLTVSRPVSDQSAKVRFALTQTILDFLYSER